MRKILLAIVFISYAGTRSFAAVFNKGDHEIGGSAEIMTGGDLKNTSFDLDWGYHFTGPHQGSIIWQYDKTEINNVSSTSGLFGLGYDYNFIDVKDDMSPYVGGSLLLPNSDLGDLYDNVLNIHGGIKISVAKRAFLRLSLNLERYAGSNGMDDSTSLALRAGYVIAFNHPFGSSSVKTSKPAVKTTQKTKPKTTTAPKKKK